MDTQITPYKLVPVNVFTDLQNSVVRDDMKDLESYHPTHKKVRSIKDIQEHAIAQMVKDNNTDNNNIDIPSVQQQLVENTKTYGEGTQKNNLAWIYQDPTTLP